MDLYQTLAGEKENPLNALPPREHVLYYIERGMEKKEALKRAAKDRGVSKSELYPFALDLWRAGGEIRFGQARFEVFFVWRLLRNVRTLGFSFVP